MLSSMEAKIEPFGCCCCDPALLPIGIGFEEPPPLVTSAAAEEGRRCAVRVLMGELGPATPATRFASICSCCWR